MADPQIILVPLDGSTFGERAIPHALTLARAGGGELELVHVRAAGAPDTYVEAQPWPGEGGSEPEADRAHAYLRSVAERVRADSGIEAGTAVLDGPVVRALLGHAERRGARLIVMTTHGRGGVSRAWLGSVADGVVRQAGVPVLLVRPDTFEAGASRYANVLVPLDGSEASEHVFGALEHVLRGGPVRVMLLRVVPLPFRIGSVHHPLSVHVDEERLAAYEEDARSYLDRVARRLRQKWPDIELEARAVAHGQPALAILELAVETGAELIAMATRGRAPLPRLVLGSVADKVLRGADAPVLLVRPPDRG